MSASGISHGLPYQTYYVLLKKTITIVIQDLVSRIHLTMHYGKRFLLTP
jgi:hypothetical protein